MTFLPSALRAFALASTFRVALSAIAAILWEIRLADMPNRILRFLGIRARNSFAYRRFNP
jgi:hypothetical protein